MFVLGYLISPSLNPILFMVGTALNCFILLPGVLGLSFMRKGTGLGLLGGSLTAPGVALVGKGQMPGIDPTATPVCPTSD